MHQKRINDILCNSTTLLLLWITHRINNCNNEFLMSLSLPFSKKYIWMKFKEKVLQTNAFPLKLDVIKVSVTAIKSFRLQLDPVTFLFDIWLQLLCTCSRKQKSWNIISQMDYPWEIQAPLDVLHVTRSGNIYNNEYEYAIASLGGWTAAWQQQNKEIGKCVVNFWLLMFLQLV